MTSDAWADSRMSGAARGARLAGSVVEVRAPASSANLGPGFDCVGLALDLYTTVRAQAWSAPEVVTDLPGVPSGREGARQNAVYRAAELLAAEAGLTLPPLRLDVTSDVPLARGLGSSAAALVGGLAAANALLGEPLLRHELLDIASREEGHPDNVGACLLGGAVIATLSNGRTTAVRFDPPGSLGVLLVVPDFELLTEKARGVLPASYSRADTVHTLSHAALLAAGLAAGDLAAIGAAMRDRMHEPYRAPLVPGLSEILSRARDHGALGAALSGAGPSVLCFYDRQDPTVSGRLQAFLSGVMRDAGVGGTVRELPINLAGTTVHVERG